MKKLAGILAIFITLPIWFYLVHWMLKASGAGELQMFLFWVYVPASLVMSVAAQAVAKD